MVIFEQKEEIFSLVTLVLLVVFAVCLGGIMLAQFG